LLYSESERIRKSWNGEGDSRQKTHGNVRHLAERVVLLVRGGLVLAAKDVNGLKSVRDVALLADESHAASAGGLGHAVESDSGHDEREVYFGGCRIAWRMMLFEDPHRSLYMMRSGSWQL